MVIGYPSYKREAMNNEKRNHRMKSSSCQEVHMMLFFVLFSINEWCSLLRADEHA